jgi:hypothetical protein
MARRTVLLLKALKNKNAQNCQISLRSVTQIIYTLPMKYVYFVAHAGEILKPCTRNSVWFKESKGSFTFCVLLKLSGTPKQKLLVTEKLAKPLCFSRNSIDRMPALQ